MNVIGPDYLVFGVDDFPTYVQYLTDYGLAPTQVSSNVVWFEALDGTGVRVSGYQVLLEACVAGAGSLGHYSGRATSDQS